MSSSPKKSFKSFLGQQKIPNRFAIEFDEFRKFSFKERLCVLIGYNPVARVKVLVDKRDGRSWASCQVGLTPLKNEKDVIAELRKLDMQEKPQNTI